MSGSSLPAATPPRGWSTTSRVMTSPGATTGTPGGPGLRPVRADRVRHQLLCPGGPYTAFSRRLKSSSASRTGTPE
ncbi:hypothetical protein AB0H29_26505 [Streptomyces thermolilacinus]